eukprot:TRINITY_DN10495_c0_g1_i1.p1 TRINITY_DN10495_c0_g1~~TRINITY_DN10495_c0_g1_i1.p1  ORF type:complete len:748 (+),score=170.98 TRINITY_DN10495_c0_g1_i1:11-2254(+)
MASRTPGRPLPQSKASIPSSSTDKEDKKKASVNSLISQYNHLDDSAAKQSQPKIKAPPAKSKTTQTNAPAVTSSSLTSSASMFFSNLFNSSSTSSTSSSSSPSTSSSPSLFSTLFGSVTSDSNATPQTTSQNTITKSTTPVSSSTSSSSTLPSTTSTSTASKYSPTSSVPITRSASATISFVPNSTASSSSFAKLPVQATNSRPIKALNGEQTSTLPEPKSLSRTPSNSSITSPLTATKKQQTQSMTLTSVTVPSEMVHQQITPPQPKKTLERRKYETLNPSRLHNAESSSNVINLSAQNLLDFPLHFTQDKSFRNIKELNLSRNKLSSLPSEILLFTSLTTLDISHNQFNTLPTLIGQFKDLQRLKIIGNPLNTAIKDIFTLGEQAVIQHLRALFATEKKPFSPRDLKNQDPCETPLDKFRCGAKKCLTQNPAEDIAKNTVEIEVGETVFSFREYSAKSFRLLRDKFMIDPKAFLNELCFSPLTELGFSGKSGSLLYQSKTGTFILKTISKQESQFLREFLPGYIEHFNTKTPSLLVQFLGHYRIFGGGLTEDDLYFLVMKNGLSTINKIDERYDLKGSTVGRKTIFSCIINQNFRFSQMILKDMDMDDLNKRIQLGPTVKQRFLAVLYNDAQFLASKQIIDYSLLLGVHVVDPKNVSSLPPFENYAKKIEEFHSPDGGYYSLDGTNKHVGRIYYMAIIDILQPYNMKKQIERAAKGLRYEKQELSVAPPKDYSERFFKFIAQHVE